MRVEVSSGRHRSASGTAVQRGMSSRTGDGIGDGASFTRLLGSNLTNALKSVAFLAAQHATYNADDRCQREKDEERIEHEEVDSNVTFATA